MTAPRRPTTTTTTTRTNLGGPTPRRRPGRGPARRPLVGGTGLLAAAVLTAGAVVPAAATPPLPTPGRSTALSASALRALPHSRSGAPVAAAGDRLLSGGIRVTLPTRIEIGAPTTTVPATVDIPALAGSGEPVAAVGLYDDRGDPVAGAAVFGQAKQTAYHLELAVSDSAVRHPGEGFFSVVGGYHAVGTADTSYYEPSFAGTRIKYHSLLGDRFTRAGDTVTVFGAARSYQPTDGTGAPYGYGSRVGVRVDLQRWTSTGWTTVRTLRTDSRGHVAATVRIPFRVGLRLATADTGEVFGAVTTSDAL